MEYIKFKIQAMCPRSDQLIEWGKCKGCEWFGGMNEISGVVGCNYDIANKEG